MNNVSFFIDGFNLYHALDSRQYYHKYKWLNLNSLANCFTTKNDKVTSILYFTALAHWDPSKVKRHQLFITANETHGVQTIYGEFKRKDKRCPICHRRYHTFEEKQTDVNIALFLFRYAIQEKYDKAFIVSGDSDLIPAIKAVKNTFPQKEIGVIIPIGRRSESLKQSCDFHMKMKEKHLQASVFDKKLILSNNQELICPSSWC